MPKRKIVRAVSGDDSDLSPPPDGLLDDPKPTVIPNGVDVKPSPRASKRRKVQDAAVSVHEGTIEPTIAVPEKVKPKGRVPRAKREVEVELKEEDQPDDVDATSTTTPEKVRKRATKVKQEQGEEELNDDGEKKVRRKRKTQAEKDNELVEMALAPRTLGHKLYIGAHVSSAGGVHNSILNSVHIGGNAFALFLKSQRKWDNPPLLDTISHTFHTHCTTHSYDAARHIVPHGSYLVNLAHTDPTRTEQAYTSFLDDLHRCERLGITLYNFHPGNDQCADRPRAIAHLASNINRAHAATSTVITLLENMAASGSNVLGSSFEDLRDTISLVHDKARIGVCLDTCHAFAAGYDLRTPSAYQATLSQFDEIVGLKYLRALHVNDSKAPFSSRRDLHANIGTGFLGLRAFHNLVNDERMGGLPLVLETPIEVRDADGNYVKDEKGKVKEDKGIWAREIKMLEGMVGMDAEGEEFLKLERELARVGEGERRRVGEQVERKREKDAKKEVKKKGGKRKQGESSESDGEEDPDDLD